MEINKSGGAERGAPGFTFSLFLAVVYFIISGLNFFRSFTNNENIFMAQAALSVMAIAVLSRKRWGAEVWVAAALIVVGIIFSNYLAASDGVFPSRWERARDFCGQVFVFALLASLLGRWSSLSGYLIFGLYAGFFFTVFLFFSLWFSLEDPAQYDWIWGISNFVNIRHLGMFVSAMFVVSLWAWLYSSGFSRVVSVIVLFFSLYLITWSGGRAAILSIMMGAAFLALFTVQSQWRIWLGVVFVSAVAVLASIAFRVEESSMGITRFFYYEKAVQGGLDSLSSGRWGVWKHAIGLIADRPFWGWGGDIYSAVKIRPELVQVHNSFLQVPLEWGLVVGFVFWGGVIFVLGKGAYFLFLKEGCHDRWLVLGLALSVVMLVHCMFDGVVYHGTPFAIFMFAIALVYSATSRLSVYEVGLIVRREGMHIQQPVSRSDEL